MSRSIRSSNTPAEKSSGRRVSRPGSPMGTEAKVGAEGLAWLIILAAGLAPAAERAITSDHGRAGGRRPYSICSATLRATLCRHRVSGRGSHPRWLGCGRTVVCGGAITGGGGRQEVVGGMVRRHHLPCQPPPPLRRDHGVGTALHALCCAVLCCAVLWHLHIYMYMCVCVCHHITR